VRAVITRRRIPVQCDVQVLPDGKVGQRDVYLDDLPILNATAFAQLGSTTKREWKKGDHVMINPDPAAHILLEAMQKKLERVTFRRELLEKVLYFSIVIIFVYISYTC
jgi:hypothetical protein